MASPVVIIVEVCTSYVGANANPRNYQVCVAAGKRAMRDGAKARTREGIRGLHSQRSVQHRRRSRPRRASVHLMRGAAHNPTQDHYQDFIQCMANVPLPLDVTLICNQATGQLSSNWPSCHGS
jgi:hypothetical protein